MPHRSAICLCLIAVVTLAAPQAAWQHSAEAATKLKTPRFASMRGNRANMRAGPGTRFPIRWVYLRKGLPVEILRNYDTWRKIRDHRGTEGWVHVGNLTGKRMVLVTKSIRPIRAGPSTSAHTVARASPNLIGKLLACKGIWCKISVRSYTGWVRRAHIWGVYADEDFR